MLYNQPGSSSSLNGRFDEQFDVQGINTSRILVVPPDEGYSQDAGGEQPPATQETSRTSEEKRKEKMERDRKRKREERKTNSQELAKICKLLKIKQTPKNTLFGRSECLCFRPGWRC
jgi:hypothetical protein